MKKVGQPNISSHVDSNSDSENSLGLHGLAITESSTITSTNTSSTLTSVYVLAGSNQPLTTSSSSTISVLESAVGGEISSSDDENHEKKKGKKPLFLSRLHERVSGFFKKGPKVSHPEGTVASPATRAQLKSLLKAVEENRSAEAKKPVRQQDIQLLGQYTRMCLQINNALSKSSECLLEEDEEPVYEEIPERSRRTSVRHSRRVSAAVHALVESIPADLLKENSLYESSGTGLKDNPLYQSSEEEDEEDLKDNPLYQAHKDDV